MSPKPDADFISNSLYDIIILATSMIIYLIIVLKTPFPRRVLYHRCPSVGLFVCLSICLSVYLSVSLAFFSGMAY